MGPVDVAGEGVQDLNGVFGGGGALNELMHCKVISTSLSCKPFTASVAVSSCMGILHRVSM